MKALPIKEVNIDNTKWQTYSLADPDFNKPGRVDVIIGTDLYTQILKKGIAKSFLGALNQRVIIH